MLFKPVYIKNSRRMQEAPIPMVRPKPSKKPPPSPSPPTPPPPAETQQEQQDNDETRERLPLLVCGPGVTAIYPKEATRDVLSGRVDYYLVDERGVTLFTKKHLFNALKLDRGAIDKFMDYPCIGAHQRILERKPKIRHGLGYKRRYISPELIGRGIYGGHELRSSNLTNLQNMHPDWGRNQGPKA